METKVLTEHEEITLILKEYIARGIKQMEEGGTFYVSGGYIKHTYKDRIIDRNCDKIVNHLRSKGYEYTTNHGFGCKDYTFTKPIEL